MTGKCHKKSQCFGNVIFILNSTRTMHILIFEILKWYNTSYFLHRIINSFSCLQHLRDKKTGNLIIVHFFIHRKLDIIQYWT